MLSLTVVMGTTILTSENFDNVIRDNTMFVKFFSPNCAHCRKLAPVWDKVASAAASSHHFLVGQVDCASESDLCNRFSIKGVPTLIFFKEGKMYKYGGNREYNDLMKFGNGDYKDAEMADLPEGPSQDFISHASYTLMRFLKDMHAIIRFNQWAVVVIFVVSVTCGALITFMMMMLLLRTDAQPCVSCEDKPTAEAEPEKTPGEKKDD